MVVSLNSRFESNKEEERVGGVVPWHARGAQDRPCRCRTATPYRRGAAGSRSTTARMGGGGALQGYLAHKKQRPTRGTSLIRNSGRLALPRLVSGVRPDPVARLMTEGSMVTLSLSRSVPRSRSFSLSLSLSPSLTPSTSLSRPSSLARLLRD